MTKILVVDDELEIRELLRKALVKEGYNVVTVSNAEQALACIIQEPFGLVLLDIKLAGESEIFVLKRIKELHQNIPVVIYSGVVTPEIEKEARIAGANEVLSKDVEIMQLVEQINRFIKGNARVSQDLSTRKEKSILIVDDELEIRRVLSTFFKKKGYTKVAAAENGEKALELARSQEFSVALLDVNMPVMDGITALEKLLEINPNLGVVMVTGRQDDENIKRAIELGAYGYILKPFDFLYLELVVMSKLAIAGSK